MKKSFLGLVLVFCTTFTHASGFIPTNTIQPIAEYELAKRYDSDPVVLEFTPRGNPKMLCVFVKSGDAGGLTCFPKEVKPK